MHALTDAMHLKDMEIERLQKDAMDAMGRGISSACSPIELTRPSLDIATNPDFGNQGTMSLNIELQAKMIEELLVKNSQLADENASAQQMRGPFASNESVDESHH